MTPEEAKRLFEEDLEHTRSHLQDKNKAPMFYEEMKRWEAAEEMAIKTLTTQTEEEKRTRERITKLESRMARIEEIFVVLSKGVRIGTKALHGWGLDSDEEKFLTTAWVELCKELYEAPEENKTPVAKTEIEDVIRSKLWGENDE